VDNSSFTNVSFNKITAPAAGTIADEIDSLIEFWDDGANNQATYNSLDGLGTVVLNGGYVGGPAEQGGGADDGIVLWNQQDSIVDHNTIINVFDTGVEGVGTITSVQITNNLIMGASESAIGGWWDSQKQAYGFQMTGSTIANNSSANVGSLLMFSQNGVAVGMNESQAAQRWPSCSFYGNH
jgi:hypothetical protein